jgi:acetyl/propionyl-CoA carboxylase alpha subunit
MLAKIIAHGADRATALDALDRALAATELAGVAHNVGFLRQVIAQPEFRDGGYDTHLLDAASAVLVPPRDQVGWICAALALRSAAAAPGSWGAMDGFRLNAPARFELLLERDEERASVAVLADRVEVDGLAFALADLQSGGGRIRCRLDERVIDAGIVVEDGEVFVIRGGDTERFRVPAADVAALAAAAGASGRVVSPMPGQVLAVNVRPGDQVRAGQVLVVIEAMKMEHGVSARGDGVVVSVACAVGDRVEENVELVTLEDGEPADDG